MILVGIPFLTGFLFINNDIHVINITVIVGMKIKKKCFEFGLSNMYQSLWKTQFILAKWLIYVSRYICTLWLVYKKSLKIWSDILKLYHIFFNSINIYSP